MRVFNYESNLSVSFFFYKILPTKPQTKLNYFNPSVLNEPHPFLSSYNFSVVGVLGFGGQFIFDLRGGGGCPMRQVLFRRVRSVHSLSILSFWNARFQKFYNFAGAAFIFNIHIFRFKADAGFQVDINFNTESKFSFSRSSKPNP